MTEFDKFRNIALLKDIEEEQCRVLFNICKRVSFDKNDEDNHSMFFFIDGEVVVSNVLTMKVSRQAGYSEVEKSIVRLNANDVGILGEMSVFEDQPRSATVKAYESCVLYEIEQESFINFLYKYSDIGVKLLHNISKMLCSRVRRGNSDVLKLTTALSIALSR
jgi:CRP/FNR family cyclic AMP-dependent transcriptional regulator